MKIGSNWRWIRALLFHSFFFLAAVYRTWLFQHCSFDDILSNLQCFQKGFVFHVFCFCRFLSGMCVVLRFADSVISIVGKVFHLAQTFLIQRFILSEELIEEMVAAYFVKNCNNGFILPWELRQLVR